MRILVLNGSPRPKGNTKQMIEAFKEGAEAAGHQVDVADVCRMKISGCLACEYCHGKGNGRNVFLSGGFPRLSRTGRYGCVYCPRFGEWFSGEIRRA